PLELIGQQRPLRRIVEIDAAHTRGDRPYFVTASADVVEVDDRRIKVAVGKLEVTLLLRRRLIRMVNRFRCAIHRTNCPTATTPAGRACERDRAPFTTRDRRWRGPSADPT